MMSASRCTFKRLLSLNTAIHSYKQHSDIIDGIMCGMHAHLASFLLQQSDIRWASRWDTYLLMTDDQIHWFSIINSLMIVLFLSGMVAMIMMRTLHRDISKCAAPCALAHCAACAAVRRAGCLVPLRILLHMHVLEACTHAAAGTTSWRQRRRRRRRPAGSWCACMRGQPSMPEAAAAPAWRQ